MEALSWDRLTNITKTVAPYRGSTNRFPIANRAHNSKCFYVEELDGETVYYITYSYRWDEHIRTEEDHKNNPRDVFYNPHLPEDDPRRYLSYTRIPNRIGIVRSDNTFEFIGEYYGQGVNTVLSSWGYGYVYRSSRHGGMVYRRGNLFHPVFKGLRLYLASMMPHESSKYQVTGKRVSRKDAKKFLAKYEDFYKINEVMFKAIDYKSALDTALDVVTNVLGTQNKITDHWGALFATDENLLLEWADKNINTLPLDSALAYAVVHDINNLRWNLRKYINNSASHPTVEALVLYQGIKRRLNKELYKRHSEVMKPVDYVMGEHYPPSEWGITITVDGKEVEQY